MVALGVVVAVLAFEASAFGATATVVYGHRSTIVGRSSTTAAQERKPPQIVYEPVPESDRLEIDGSKNPEMIPQWDAWLAAFDQITRSRDLPTEVWKHINDKEAESIRAAARENARNFQALQDRVLKMLPLLQAEGQKASLEKTQAMNIEFRWQVLGLRDRVLASLNPSGQAALSGYVESLKAGMRVLVSRKELAYYRTPE
jgi:hypothetical protein